MPAPDPTPPPDAPRWEPAPPGPRAARPEPDGWTAVWARPSSEPAPGPPGGHDAPAPLGSPGAATPPSPRRRWVGVLAALAMVVLLVGGAVAGTLGVRTAWDAVGGGWLTGVEDGETYGDNPVLDGYWDDCEDGDGLSCDELYYSSGVGTEYERFGVTCGDRYSETSAPEYCEDELADAAPVREGLRRGDDAVLDRLWEDCGGGDGIACDELYASSEEGSEYEGFGLTCGERYSALRAPDFCADALR